MQHPPGESDPRPGGAPQQEQERRSKTFLIREGISLSVDLRPGSDASEWLADDIIVTITTEEGTVPLSLRETLGDDMIFVVDTSGINVFGTDHRTHRLTVSEHAFAQDPERALFSTLHEAGHELDAPRDPEAYSKDVHDSTIEETEAAERGANEQVRALVASVEERRGVAIFSLEQLDVYIHDQLLGYQVGYDFDKRSTRPPRFLDETYDAAAWADRFQILDTAVQEVEQLVKPLALEMARRFTDGQKITTTEAQAAFEELFVDVPHLNHLRQELPYYFDRFASVIREGSYAFFGESFEEVASQGIADFLAHPKLGIPRFIAHERLLAPDTKPYSYGKANDPTRS